MLRQPLLSRLKLGLEFYQGRYRHLRYCCLGCYSDLIGTDDTLIPCHALDPIHRSITAVGRKNTHDAIDVPAHLGGRDRGGADKLAAVEG
jgi:hypothetical protein